MGPAVSEPTGSELGRLPWAALRRLPAVGMLQENGAGAQKHSALKAVLEIAEAALKYILSTFVFCFVFK